MSNRYKSSKEVPSSVLAKRLDELSDAAAKGRDGHSEFNMRIPAEVDRDADIVLAEASARLGKELFKRIQVIRSSRTARWSGHKSTRIQVCGRNFQERFSIVVSDKRAKAIARDIAEQFWGVYDETEAPDGHIRVTRFEPKRG